MVRAGMRKKTTVYLTQREYAALKRAALNSGRSMSMLIREGVRRVSYGLTESGKASHQQDFPSPAGPPTVQEPSSPVTPWPSRLEERAWVLRNLGYEARQIAIDCQVGTPEAALALIRSADAKYAAMENDREAAPTGSADKVERDS